MATGPKLFNSGDAAIRQIWSSRVTSKAIWNSIFLNPTWGFVGQEQDSKMICEAKELDGEAGITATLTMVGQMTGDGTVDGEPVEGLGTNYPHYTFTFDIHELTAPVFEVKSQYEDQKVSWDVAARGRRAQIEWWNVPLNVGFPIQGCGWAAVSGHGYYRPDHRDVVGNGKSQQYALMNTVNTANLNDGGSSGVRVYRPNSRTTDETLVAGDEFSVDLVDHMAAVLPQLEFPFRQVRWAGGESLLWFIHTDQLYDLQRDSRFQAIEDAILMGGGDYSKSTYNNNTARPYKGFCFIVTNWMPPGLNSTTAAPTNNTRRSMICGAGAFALRFGIGHSRNQLQTSMGRANRGGAWWCATRLMWGGKRIDYNSTAYATYVVPTYAVNRGDTLTAA